ncbi:MAG: alpha/beta hydrolase [Tatlockia sp.]|nr:alpha/beta hydrolase [Tatlockia sp.]
MRELIHFAHGNGFPSPCYKQLFDELQSRFDCCYIDKIGHNPHFPVQDNWHFLVDELIDSVKTKANKPVIAIGHSVGGVLSLLAAIEQPSLFKAVIMLDSPLPGRFKSSLILLAKTLGVIDTLTPAHLARRRRQFWQSREELLTYLKSRPLFKSFTNECLEDYIDYGLQKTANGYTLRFDRHIEYLIYRTVPHRLYAYEGQLSVPAALIYGDKSEIVDRFDVRYMKRKYNIKSYKMKGSHMLTMEHPKEVAGEIVKALDAIII